MSVCVTIRPVCVLLFSFFLFLMWCATRARLFISLLIMSSMIYLHHLQHVLSLDSSTAEREREEGTEERGKSEGWQQGEGGKERRRGGGERKGRIMGENRKEMMWKTGKWINEEQEQLKVMKKWIKGWKEGFLLLVMANKKFLISSVNAKAKSPRQRGAIKSLRYQLGRWRCLIVEQQ